MSWFGWKSLKEAERYTRTANQKKLAASVVQMFKRDEARTKVTNLPGPNREI
jgi:hypothetical protein